MGWMEDEPVRGGYPTMEFLAYDGLERMQAAVDGLMPRPPIYHLFGLKPTATSRASTTFVMPASPWLQTAFGVFLPGVAALLADAPLGSAVLTELGPGPIAVTSDLTLNYLRPMYPSSGLLSCQARPIDVGRRLGLAEALIEDAGGNVIAHSTTRCFIQNLPVPERLELPPVESPAYDTPDPHERLMTAGFIPPEVLGTTGFIELCEMVARGELPTPPFAQLIGMEPAVAAEGTFSTSVQASPWFTSPAGTVYGGFLAFLADSVLGGAFATVIPPNSTYAALDLKVSFLRPVMPDGRRLTASATVVHRGRSLVVADAEIRNADGKVVVKATSSAAVLEGRSWTRAVIDEAENREPAAE
jgi:uncharacterized protein (TIGR00369 family)